MPVPPPAPASPEDLQRTARELAGSLKELREYQVRLDRLAACGSLEALLDVSDRLLLDADRIGGPHRHDPDEEVGKLDVGDQLYGEAPLRYDPEHHKPYEEHADEGLAADYEVASAHRLRSRTE